MAASATDSLPLLLLLLMLGLGLGCARAQVQLDIPPAEEGGGVSVGRQPRAVPVLCNFLCLCGVPNRGVRTTGARLDGGEDIRNLEFPWLATVYVGGNITGGGGLISNRYVLTSASTVSGVAPSAVRVTLGSSNLCAPDQTSLNVSVTTIKINPNYDPTTQTADLALLRLSISVPYGNTIRPACLPARVNEAYYGNVAIVVSWGLNATASAATTTNTTTNATATTRCRARKMPLAILDPRRDCNSANLSRDLFTADKGCVGAPGVQSFVCQSDGGGLVMYDPRIPVNYFQIIGILNSGNRCNVTGPSLFTRTAPYLVWLLDGSSDSCYCRAPR